MSIDNKVGSDDEEPLEALLRILDFILSAMENCWKVLSEKVTSDLLCKAIIACKVENGEGGAKEGSGGWAPVR